MANSFPIDRALSAVVTDTPSPTMGLDDQGGAMPLPADAAADPNRPITEELEKRVIKTVMESLAEAEEDRDQRAKDWVIYYKFYRGVYDFKNDFPFKNQMVPPLAFSIVETITPRLINGIFGSRKFLATIPQDDETDPVQAEQVGDLLLYQCHKEINIVPRLTPWMKSAAIYGTAVCQVGWSERTEKVFKRKTGIVPGSGPYPIAGGIEEQVEIKKSQPTVEPLILYDFWIDPRVSGPDAIQDAAYCIRREDVRPSELSRRMKDETSGYMMRPEVLKSDFAASSGGASNEETEYRDQQRTAIGLPSLWGDMPTSRRNKPIELLHYWGEFQETDTGEWKDVVITVANRKVAVRYEENPFGGMKPLISFVPTPDSCEFYGIGEVEAVDSLLEAYICWFNQAYDNVALSLSPMWLTRGEAILDIDEIMNPKPGAIVRVDPKFAGGLHLDDVAKPMEAPSLPTSGWRMEDTIKQLVDRTVGQYDYTRGDTSDTANSTATGISAIIGEANARFQSKIQVCQYQFITQLGKWLLRLNARYLPPDKVIRILGEDGGNAYLTIPLDALVPEYDVEAIGAPLLGNKAMLRDQLSMFIQMASQNPNIGQWFPIPTWRVITSQMVDLLELQSVKLKSVKVLEQEMQQQAQQQAARAEQNKLDMATNALQLHNLKMTGVEPETIREAQQFAEQEAEQDGQAGGAPPQM